MEVRAEKKNLADGQGKRRQTGRQKKVSGSFSGSSSLSSAAAPGLSSRILRPPPFPTLLSDPPVLRLSHSCSPHSAIFLPAVRSSDRCLNGSLGERVMVRGRLTSTPSGSCRSVATLLVLRHLPSLCVSGGRHHAQACGSKRTPLQPQHRE